MAQSDTRVSGRGSVGPKRVTQSGVERVAMSRSSINGLRHLQLELMLSRRERKREPDDGDQTVAEGVRIVG